MERWHSSVTMKSKVSMGKSGLYSIGSGSLNRLPSSRRRLLVDLLGQFPPLEHRVEALDGADADPRRGVERVAGQALDDVLLGELEVVVGRDVLLELLQGLAAEVAAIDQEEDPPGAGELDQPVDEVDGGEGLAAAGGHLDQGAGTVAAQRVFEVVDRLDLRRPQALRYQLRHLLQAGEEGLRLRRTGPAVRLQPEGPRRRCRP